MGRFDEKVAVVSGGASGIGKAVCELFSRNGARVALFDVAIEAAKTVAREISRDEKGALAVPCDVTDETQVREGFDQVVRRFGRIDILHVNAGIIIKKQYVTQQTLEDWNRIISINLTGAFLTAKYGIMQMQKGKGGNVIFTASNWAFVYEAGFSSYAASKGAIVAFGRALAVDHAKDNIRVNVICPGDTNTPLMERMLQWEKEETLGGHQQMLSPELQGQLASPEEIANLVLFLASDEASAMKGSVVIIDHGQTLGYGSGLSAEQEED
jgi:NAD(P)-dependent dehydrogenase (short-subunit alcohol dehydrogenase family)